MGFVEQGSSAPPRTFMLGALSILFPVKLLQPSEPPWVCEDWRQGA
jgi:hypothetical protein